MKRKIKRIASLVLAMVMVFAMAVPAMAAEEGAGSCKIKIKNSAKGHTYEAYQIFSGDLGTSDDGKMLGNIKWGTGVDAEKLSTLKDKLKTAGIAADSTEDAASDAYARAVAYALNDLNAKQFAQIVGEFLSTQKKTTNTSTEGVYEINGLDSGYYLVKDKNGSLDSMNNEAYTEFILRVLGEEEINAKSGVPEVEKEVKEKMTLRGDHLDGRNGQTMMREILFRSS